ncbi:glycoprotein [Ruloma virus]|uniref:Glycoprotein n=1 Tax=Ruloma virus TaxID=2811341 RepID=A0AAE7Q3C9_9MONO|nr:glycoprotein [Ruloma virus]QRN45790.1 glycoprotein [Ruloma virus]
MDNSTNYYGTSTQKNDNSKQPISTISPHLGNTNSIKSRLIPQDITSILCSWFWGPMVTIILIVLISITLKILMDHETAQQSYSTLITAIRSEIISTKDLVFENISPKINLVNTMVSYTIPSLLNSLRGEILDELLRKQTPIFEYKNHTCPVVQHPAHSSFFKELDQDTITRCIDRGMQISLKGEFNLQEVPSFIPSQTTSRGCTRIPSFSLSPYIWAYTHNVVRLGCSDSGMSDQYLAIGVISEGGGKAPIFETLATWYTDDEINRKSCSVAAGITGAWMGCSIVTETEQNDVGNPGISSIFISYLDIYREKRSWIYTETQLPINGLFTYLTFAVGSGVVVGDKVYLPMYGSLTNDNNYDCFCYSPGCDTFNITKCNEGCRPTWLSNKLFVTVIMIFSNDPTVRPIPTFVILNPKSGWMGAETRLIHNYRHGITYIYTRSSTWHALPQIGRINLKDFSQVLWITYLGIGRPSLDPCPATQRCPRDCIGGVFSDIFPLGRYYEFGVTVYLDSDRNRERPTIALLNVARTIKKTLLTTATQRAAYSTTTCFIFKDEPWCLTVVELNPSAIGEYIPIPFTYTLPLICTSLSDTEGSVMTNNGGDIKVTIPSSSDVRGQTVTLRDLKLNWSNYKTKLPHVFYPQDYSSSGNDIFENDVMINPSAIITATQSTLRRADNPDSGIPGIQSESLVSQSRVQRNSDDAVYITPKPLTTPDQSISNTEDLSINNLTSTSQQINSDETVIKSKSLTISSTNDSIIQTSEVSVDTTVDRSNIKVMVNGTEGSGTS